MEDWRCTSAQSTPSSPTCNPVCGVGFLCMTSPVSGANFCGQVAPTGNCTMCGTLQTCVVTYTDVQCFDNPPVGSGIPDTCNVSCSPEQTCINTGQYGHWRCQNNPASIQPAGPGCPANNPSCDITYTPLEPLPTALGGSGAMGPGLAGFLNYLFPILITLGAMAGVLLFTFYGVEYMLTPAVPLKTKALSHLYAVIWGLVLLISSVLILYTINPNLTNFRLDSLLGVAGLAGQSSGGPGTTPQAQPAATTEAPPATPAS